MSKQTEYKLEKLYNDVACYSALCLIFAFGFTGIDLGLELGVDEQHPAKKPGEIIIDVLAVFAFICLACMMCKSLSKLRRALPIEMEMDIKTNQNINISVAALSNSNMYQQIRDSKTSSEVSDNPLGL